MTVLTDRLNPYKAPFTPRKHPAKFSDPITDAIHLYLDGVDPHGAWRVLDPFAGVGRVHRFATAPGGRLRSTIASELEPEWIVQGGARSLIADAHRLPFPDDAFDAVVTSPCYGNRLADLYDGQGQCRQCKGHPETLDGATCGRCGGAGHDTSTRLTYRLHLDRLPSRNSATTLQWGPAYRAFHRTAWAECARVLRASEPERARPALFILNVSDHQRDREFQGVPDWHVKALEDLGFVQRGHLAIATSRYRKGTNHKARAGHEMVVVFDAPAR